MGNQNSSVPAAITTTSGKQQPVPPSLAHFLTYQTQKAKMTGLKVIPVTPQIYRNLLTDPNAHRPEELIGSDTKVNFIYDPAFAPSTFTENYIMAKSTFNPDEVFDISYLVSLPPGQISNAGGGFTIAVSTDRSGVVTGPISSEELGTYDNPTMFTFNLPYPVRNAGEVNYVFKFSNFAIDSSVSAPTAVLHSIIVRRNSFNPPVET